MVSEPGAIVELTSRLSLIPTLLSTYRDRNRFLDSYERHLLIYHDQPDLASAWRNSSKDRLLCTVSPVAFVYSSLRRLVQNIKTCPALQEVCMIVLVENSSSRRQIR
jgi:hypothetical protein